MDKVYKYIADSTGKGKIDKQVAIRLLMELQDQKSKSDDIAIVGMSVNLPFASDIQQFWENLRDGRDCIREFPDSRRADIDRYLVYTGMRPNEIKYMRGAYLDRIDQFDYRFFHFTPREASLMDPCQRLFLQTAWQAIEDAGYSGEKLVGSRTGVYVGFATTIKDNYQKLIHDIDPDLVPVSIVATLPAMIPTRLSYMLDLKGPAISVDTACSSSLVAVHLACRGIQNGECDMAIAGGVKIHTVPLDKDQFRLGIESSDGRTRAFDDSSDGTGIGEGIGVVLLKPYKKAVRDKDHIYAVIKGSAINQDGKTIGITAPNQISQYEVIVKAWENSGINPETISYIQTHGTGTELGDPIEIDGLRRAFSHYTNKKQFCAIGSVKTNIGHLYEGAGIINLISAALAVKNAQIPPSLHFCFPNRKINFEETAVYVNDKLAEWKKGDSPRRCGVSSFGFSGTNCHVVLEEYASSHMKEDTAEGTPQIFVLSARSSTVLKTMLGNYVRWLSSSDDALLNDICYTAGTGRSHYDHRIAFVARSKQELLEKLGKLCKYELDDTSSHGCCWGVHDMRREDGLVNEAAAKVMKEFLGSGGRDVKKLEELCSLYTKGASIDWNEFYKNRQAKRISIPPYSFEQDRCWIEIDEQKYAKALSMKTGHLFYGLMWKEKSAAGFRPHNPEETIIAFGDISGKGRELLDELGSRGNRIITVRCGQLFQETSPCSYDIQNREEDYIRLLRELKKERITRIILLQALSQVDEAPDIETLDARNFHGVISLFFLAKAIQKTGMERKTEIILVTAGACSVTGNESRIHPEQAAMVGLGKVIGTETKNIVCRNIDTDDDTCVSLVADELSVDCRDYQICFRKGKRYGQEFCRIDMDAVRDDDAAVEENGVYIITGGLGGIGIETARYLSSKKKVNLILTGRTILPPEEEWGSIQDSPDKGLYDKISEIERIRKTGSNVEYISADISEKNDVEALLHMVKTKYGKINGIVHSAGIAGDGFILNKDIEEFKRVLAPKVRGTWLLDRLTSQEPLDFFIMYSSGASLLGEPGQGDYTAANAFMDSFAEYRAGKGRRTLAINWVAWKETGMAFNYGSNRDTFFKAIPTKDAICGLDTVFHKNITRVLIGELNICGKTEYFLDRLPFDVSEEIRASIVNRHEDRSAASEAIKPADDVILRGKEQNDGYTDTEKIIGLICKEILGYKEIDIYENFFDLGGDSVLLTKMHAEIDKRFPGRLTIADMFSYSSIAKLADYLNQDPEMAKPSVKADQQQAARTGTDIAVIGIAVRFPQADDIDEFWDNLINGKDCITDFPKARERDISPYVSQYLRLGPIRMEYSQGGYLNDIDKFDYRFFRITPNEASFMDPNQRLFLETIWEAIEDAGYGGERLAGTKTGIFVGFAKTIFDYERLISDVYPQKYAGSVVANLASIIPSRLSYLLDFKGPTAVIDTACSSSLVAVHMARRSIINGECDMAFAGGVKINLIPLKRDRENGVGIESSDDRTRTFDDSADGTGIGEGVGVVLLKRLDKAIDDRDHIYAVIKGSAVNQDGASASLTSPNANSQTDVLLAAWSDANIEAQSLSYIEAHGTGTKLGDPIEIEGIKKAFAAQTDRYQCCAIGSVKTNIGHLYEGAGIASLIKTILILKKKQIPPSLHFITPNRRIRFEDSPVYVNDRLIRIDNGPGPVRCAVSAFGFSGTNCHMVLEEAPSVRNEEADPNTRYIFVLSAKSPDSLYGILESFIMKKDRWMGESLRDICFTMAVGRGHYNHRLAFLVRDNEELLQKLAEALYSPSLAELPSGMFYHEHRLCNADEIRDTEHDISGEEIRKLTRSADAIINALTSGYEDNSEYLSDICRLYVAGANVPWEKLYAGSNAGSVSLPVYKFERKRCWMDIPPESASDSAQQEHLHYCVEWVQDDMQPSVPVPAEGAYLVFEDECGLHAEIAAALRSHGNSVLQVSIGNMFRKIGENRYEIGNNQDDYIKLLHYVRDMDLSGIIHLSSVTKERGGDSPESLERSLQLGVYSLFRLAKAMAAVGTDSKMQLVIISKYVNRVDQNEKCILPENAPIFGLGKIIGKENPNIKCRCIDIDDLTPITRVINNLADDTGTYTIAYRAGKRYSEEFRERTIPNTDSTPARFRDKGIYIITGGLGGIGMEMARYLASGGARNIALINRTPFPERYRWEEILSGNPRGMLAGQIKKIREIEALGAEIIPLAADISDYPCVREVIGGLKKNYGNINGIIHCAGIAVVKNIADKSEAEFRQTLLPKIHGTWALDSLTRDDELDLFVMSSSVATVFGTMGQGDYAAANAYMDSFAQYRRVNGRHAMTVNWVAWKEVGMAVEHGFTIDTIFKAIRTKPAMEAFHKALSADLDRVLIGEINYQNSITQYMKNYSIKLSGSIQRKLDDSLRGHERKNRISMESAGRLQLEGRNDGQSYTEIEKTIARILCEEMGYDDIDIRDNFFDIGGDSIIMSKIRQRLNDEFPGKVTITDLFEYPTIEKLAGFIDAQEDNDKQAGDPDHAADDYDLETRIALMVDEFEEGSADLDMILKDLDRI